MTRELACDDRLDSVAPFAPALRKCSAFELRNHPQNGRLQLRQINSRGFPQNLVVDAVIFMPQRIADGDDVGPWRFWITRPQLLRQGARGLGNDLDRALGDPAKRA